MMVFSNVFFMHKIQDVKIAVIGLGYVGLPLAIAFGKKRSVIGYDINAERVAELQRGHDRTKEISPEELRSAQQAVFTADEKDLACANFYILALPTPVNEFNVPDFDSLVSASETVARHLTKGDVVVYESTVYPGATREVCVPVLERTSGLVFNKDFFVGYSPERISPADKSKVSDIVKVTSGSTKEAAKLVDAVYKEIITAGTFPVSSLEVAEACKVIENAQRDVNIGFMNEVAILMNKLDIDTKEVLQAMKTKWNALSFVPGLVGGHCIGIDPYYLVHKAQSVGHNMGIVKATRTMNDSMGFYIAGQIVKLMAKKKINIATSRVLLLGATFKENCPDIRNARPLDIKESLEQYGAKVDVYDPVADPHDVKKYYGFSLIKKPKENTYDAIVIAVMHKQFASLGIKAIKAFGKKNSVIYDLKSIYKKTDSHGRL